MLLDKISNLDVELDVNLQITLKVFLNRVGAKIPIAAQQCTTADGQGNLSVVARVHNISREGECLPVQTHCTSKLSYTHGFNLCVIMDDRTEH